MKTQLLVIPNTPGKCDGAILPVSKLDGITTGITKCRTCCVIVFEMNDYQIKEAYASSAEASNRLSYLAHALLDNLIIELNREAIELFNKITDKKTDTLGVH